MPGNIVNDRGSTCVLNGFHLWNSWSTIYSFIDVIVCTYDTFRPKFIKIITNGIIENSPGFKKIVYHWQIFVCCSHEYRRVGYKKHLWRLKIFNLKQIKIAETGSRGMISVFFISLRALSTLKSFLFQRSTCMSPEWKLLC